MTEEIVNMEKVKQSVPQLRFSGFKEAWVSRKLKDWDLTVIDGDRGVNYPKAADFSPDGFCLFLNAKNVTKKGFSFKTKMFISEAKDNALSKGKLKRGDLILTTRGSVGHIAFYNEEIEFDNLRINSGMVLIRNQNQNISSEFIYALFFAPKTTKQIATIAFGSAQPQLTVKEINKFKFLIPSLPEQQKIATFLSAVDKKIAQLTRKKALLEQYKKGVMQQLFSRQLRFKDELGRAFPEWEEKKLGEIGKIVTGKTPKTSESKLWGGDIQFVTPTDINALNKYQYFTKRHVVKTSKMEVLPKKTIMYTCIASIGKMSLSVHPCVTNQQINSLIPEKDYSNEFIFYTLLFATPKIKSTQANTTLPIINKKEFSRIKVLIPSIQEQQKIANYLSVIDEKINTVTQQITKSQAFKKGLLQQLFV